LLITNKLRVSA